MCRMGLLALALEIFLISAWIPRSLSFQQQKCKYLAKNIAHYRSHFPTTKFSNRPVYIKLQTDENTDIEGGNVVSSSTVEDPAIQAKLKAELSSPFRLIRQYLFAATGMAGGLGTITTIPQLIKAWSIEAERNTALINIAIDIGALVIGTGLFVWDSDQGQKKINAFKSVEEKKRSKLSKEDVKKREELLGLLPVEIVFSEYSENETRVVPLSDIWLRGQQCIIIVAGEYDFVDKSIFGALAVSDSDFRSQQVFIAPFVVDLDEGVIASQIVEDETTKKGFGSSVAPKRSLMSAPYIAKPTQLSAWKKVLDLEFELAEAQGIRKVREKGLVIGINREGKIVRRGYGSPKWKDLIAEVSDSSRRSKEKG